MNEQERLRWLRERIYRPRERVRARQLTNGKWEVFDGAAVHTLTDQDFRDNYELGAQSQKLVKEHGQHEYHVN